MNNINQVTKRTLNDIDGLEKYILGIECKEMLELPYIVASYLASYYFETECGEIRKEITKLISKILISTDPAIRDLALAGFFESHGFDNMEKVKIFYNTLPKEAQKVIDDIHDFRDGFVV